MANTRGTKSGITLTCEEFVPPSGWTQDSAFYYLLVDLPGFRKEQLRLQVNNRGEIITSGEKQAIENKYKRFKETFKIPENSDIEKIRGKFEGEVLYVTIPKLLPKGSLLEEGGGGGGGDLLQSVARNVIENKGIVITAVLAFSLGVMLSPKLGINSN